MRVQALFAVALLSLTAAGADAACPRPTEAQPEVPNGAKADDATMKQAHDALQAYVVKLEAYKACLSDLSKTAPADTPEEQKLTWAAQGDAAVDEANYAANQFSYALKTFKARAGSTPQ